MVSVCGLFINCTESIGIIIGQATTTTTGSMFLTLMMVLLLLMAIGFMFGIRSEYLAIIILPLVLAYAAFYQEFMGTLAVILIYLSLILTKNFLFK